MDDEMSAAKNFMMEEKDMNADAIMEQMKETKDNLHFEDEFDDVYDEEEYIEEDEENSEDYMTDDENEPETNNNGAMNIEKNSKDKRYKLKQKKSKKEKLTAYTGTGQDLDKDEYLDFENKAYEMLHRATTEWPCMTIDWLVPEPQMMLTNSYKPRKLDLQQSWQYPLELYAVAGSMASQPSKNQLYVLKFSRLMETKNDDDSISDDDEDDENKDGDEPVIFHQAIPLKAGVNRVRAMHNQPIVALWDESRKVQIYDIKKNQNYLQGLTDQTSKHEIKVKGSDQRLLNSFTFPQEGFGLEWSPHTLGRLQAGSCDGNINVIQTGDEYCAAFQKEDVPYTYHDESVEDLQFSPTEAEVFASCSVDGTVQIVDMRVGDKKNSQLKIMAHECDVNVISWNGKSANLLASGGDEGAFKVWDLRFVKEPPITNVQWHTQPITSIQWNVADEWSLAVASADHRISFWDLSVEPDDDMKEENADIPDQLMFQHQGQEDIKEIRYFIQ